MAEGNNFSRTPKKFNRGHSEPTKMNKFNYKGGVWNAPMPYNASCAIDPTTGKTDHPKNSDGEPREGTYFSGWLYYIPERLPGNVLGKKFALDFAWFAGTKYYDGTGNPTLYIDVSFYSEISKSWSGWKRLSRTYNAPPSYGIAVGGGIGSVDYFCYDRRGDRSDSFRPLCGFNPHLTTEILSRIQGQSFDTYSSLYAFLTGSGLHPAGWDGGHVSFLAAPPVGVRYMSLDGWWDKGGKFISSKAAGVSSSYSPAGYKTASSLDGGDNTDKNSLISFYITEDFIRDACGGIAGITKFRLRFWKGGSSYWDWPADGMDQWMALDNPRVGLLDWSEPDRYTADWPPRYDARAWYRDKSADIQQPELMCMYNYAGGTERTWTIN